MKSQIVSCAMLTLALSVSCALAEEIKPIKGPGFVTKDTAVASKIIGNGLMPDGRECIVGTTPDCAAKAEEIASKIIGNGFMPDGRECIVGTTPDCAAKTKAIASKATGKTVAAAK
ncbi:hypothetical protein SAMN04488498_1013 [Mesorhizobium albiziae]|uniref:Uncharacterized protein n=1 Tax=Neomesorhizobium albiziae TaxID=335020 RepID=A0A1I3UTC4_9HYPH|nr:hypothetical protein [Mesorhizobium albiziae]GLS28466.1 hypothetical protein GCM10007937_01730 [Mesorhizobium albiziae]SFJ86215.1 hypothetical protein SAMN04488498_1013 [Mesorhizobium albiziae]